MTEAEWLADTDPNPLVGLVGSRLSERKARLFAVACCRRVWGYLVDERSRRAVETIEAWLEGGCDQVTLTRAREGAWQAELDRIRQQDITFNPGSFAAFCSVALEELYLRQAHGASLHAAMNGAAGPPFPSNRPARIAVRDAELSAQAVLIRDIFGNPFRPVSFSPEWRTSAAVAIAQQMYGSRDFSAMPILADALQDAGCDSDDVLAHCRDPQQAHVRGCWVVDLVLGKS